MDVRRVTLVIALGIPVAFTAVATARGYSLDRALASRSAAAYVAAVALLGVAVAVAWWHRAAVAAGVGALAAVTLPIWPVVGSAAGAGTAVGHHVLVGDAAAAVLAVTLLGAVEYAVRNPSVVGATLTPRSLRVGLVIGVVHATAVFAGGWLHDLDWALRAAGEPLSTLWILGGAVVVGAVAGVLAVSHGLALPGLLVAALFSWAWFASPVDPGAGRAVTLLVVYAVLWFVPLVAAVAAGVAEVELRGLVGRFLALAGG